MATLAIRGHENRGKEVIEILEMLGGKNKHGHSACFDNLYYFLDKSNNIIDYGYVKYLYKAEDALIFTLEEFLEKFPYKVGDKAIYNKDIELEVVKMYWDDKFNIVRYDVQGVVNKTFTLKGLMATHLQPYQEEIMKEEDMKNGIVYDEIDFNRCPAADKVHLILGTNYEIREESGEYYVVKKLPKNPKTYEECCKVLDYCGDYFLTTYDNNGKPSAISNILNSVNVLTKLLICRNAYWKIAGEEMGLGKPWEPDFDNEDEYKYGLFRLRNIIYKDATCINPTLLIFPTAEMRDTFYDNFKKEIEECKELL